MITVGSKAFRMASRVVVAVAAALSLSACSTTAMPTTQSILANSSPAAGSTVTGPVEELALHFSPPARLDEVTVSGPDGSMPMMLTPVGEVSTYSLPVSELGAGNYRVTWKAASRGRAYQGSFSFIVR